MKMFRSSVCVVSALLVLPLWGCSKSADKDVLARVDDEVITAQEFRNSLDALPAQWKVRARTPSGRKQILEHQVRSKLIELEARERGIDRRPDVKYQIDQAVQRILLQELMKEWQREIKIPDDEIEAYYKQNIDKYRQKEQYRAQHILIKVAPDASEAEVEKARKLALKARKRVEAGEPFEKVAREMSQGPSASRGGDLGYAEKGRYAPAFEKAALALKPGEISEPVRTPFGWHIIRLVDIKKSSERPLDDELRKEIEQALLPKKRQEMFEANMKGLREKFGVEIDEKLLAELDIEQQKKP